MNRYLLKSTIVAALGGLLFGFDTVVISGATSTLSEVYQLTPMLLGFTVASALLGTVLGSMFAGAPSDRYGRRQCLQALAVLYVVTALGCALAWNWYAFVWFRFVGGLAIGGSSVIGPMYIAEIAPAAKRGRLVGLFQFNIVAGILIAYLSNYAIGTLGLGAEEWRWKLGVATLPAVFFFVTLFGIPQSPRWLIRRGFIEEARQIFTRIGEPDPDREVADVIRSVKSEDRTKVEPLFQRKYRRPIMLAIAIGFFNQMSGINAILYYLNDIFKSAGFDKVSSDLQAVAIGATNLLFTIIAMSVIDRLGRKKLLLTGAAGTAVCLAGVAVIFATGAGRAIPRLAAHRLHRLLRLLARRRHLGLSQRSISQPGARQGPEPRQFHPLDHERHHCVHLPPGGAPVAPRPVRLLRRDDRGSVLRRPAGVPRNRRHHPRRHAGEDGDARPAAR